MTTLIKTQKNVLTSKMGNIIIILKTENSRKKLLERLVKSEEQKKLAEVKELEEEQKRIIVFNIPANQTNEEIEEKAHNQMNP